MDRCQVCPCLPGDGPCAAALEHPGVCALIARQSDYWRLWALWKCGEGHEPATRPTPFPAKTHRARPEGGFERIEPETPRSIAPAITTRPTIAETRRLQLAVRACPFRTAPGCGCDNEPSRCSHPDHPAEVWPDDCAACSDKFAADRSLDKTAGPVHDT